MIYSLAKKFSVITLLLIILLSILASVALYFYVKNTHKQESLVQVNDPLTVNALQKISAQNFLQEQESEFQYDNPLAGVRFRIEKNWNGETLEMRGISPYTENMLSVHIHDPQYGPEQGSESISPNAMSWTLDIVSPGHPNYEEAKQKAAGEYELDPNQEIFDSESGFPNYFITSKEQIHSNGMPGYRYVMETKTKKNADSPIEPYILSEYILLNDGRILSGVALIGYGNTKDQHIALSKELLSKVELYQPETQNVVLLEKQKGNATNQTISYIYAPQYALGIEYRDNWQYTFGDDDVIALILSAEKPSTQQHLTDIDSPVTIGAASLKLYQYSQRKHEEKFTSALQWLNADFTDGSVQQYYLSTLRDNATFVQAYDNGSSDNQTIIVKYRENGKHLWQSDTFEKIEDGKILHIVSVHEITDEEVPDYIYADRSPEVLQYYLN